MEPYLVAAIVVIVTTIVVVVLWIKGKSDSGIESKASAISPTKQPSPVPTLPIKRAPSPVSDEVNALDDTPREKAVVWEEIEGVQVVEVDYNDHSDEHEDHESPDQHLNTEDRGQTEEQHEDTYDEEEGEVFDENRDSQAGFEEDHYDEGDYQDESPRVSESNVSPLSPDAPAAEEKRSPPKRTVSRTLSKESSGSLSPMGNPAGKTLYKFGSHYKKGGDSWVVNQNTEATAAAASPVGVSPVRMPQLKKIIPVHNESQPLSRKQSNKISQYEAGLEQEKQKIGSRVLETRRRNIQDVVNRVILDGDAAEVPAEIDPIVLLVDPTVDVKTKKIVKQMTVKFSAAAGAAGAASADATAPVESSDCVDASADSRADNRADNRADSSTSSVATSAVTTEGGVDDSQKSTDSGMSGDQASSNGITTSSEKSEVTLIV